MTHRVLCSHYDFLLTTFRLRYVKRLGMECCFDKLRHPSAFLSGRLGMDCCFDKLWHPSAFLSGACASYLDVALEPLAFRNEELEGLLKLNFGRLVLGVSF